MSTNKIFQTTKDSVNKFLKDLKEKNLIKFQNPSLSKLQESQRRAELIVIANKAFAKISIWHNTSKQKGENVLEENEYVAMNKLFYVYSMQANTEELKTYLKIIIDPDLICPCITGLGKYLSAIYDKLEYTSKQRQELNKVLFVELRNALAHLDYDITLENFTYRNKNNESFTITNEQLMDLYYQYLAIGQTFNEYIMCNESR